MTKKLNVSLDWSYTTDVEDVPGNAMIYMILCGAKNDEGKIVTSTYKVLDIGQTGSGGTRLPDHDRKDCWEEKKLKDHILVYKYALMPSSEYDEEDRRIVECCLRSHTTPACGEECNNGYTRDDTVTIINTGDKSPLNTTYSCKKK